MRQSHGGIDDGAHGDGDGGLVLRSVVAGPVYAEAMVDCINARIEQRKVGHAELDREARACEGGR